MATAMRLAPAPMSTDRKVVDIPHVEQCYSWDCGLACLSMVLKFFDIPPSEIYTKDLDTQQCGESVWTIDLAYILSRYEIPHLLCTITLGANVEHASKAFYSGFTKDEKRVNELFQEAEEQGVTAKKRKVTLEEVMDHLSTGCVAIVLIDWRYLECISCHPHIRNCCFCCMDVVCSGYQGHFIVACGYDKVKKFIYYKNPNTPETLCCCRFDSYEKARKSYGTDEDILFIYKRESRPEGDA